MIPYANFLKIPKKPNALKSGERIKVVALANPNFNLPHSQEEVQSIKELSIYDLSKPLYGQNATLNQLQGQLQQLQQDQPNILHLSTHNTIGSHISLETYLTLAGTPMLKIDDVDQLTNINAIDLVVLSACQTDIGDITKGDAVFNLTHTFSRSGVPSAITTLWNIDDKASSDLMKSFYENLAKGMSKAEALQKAQITVLNTKGYSHPYYWAAFMLTGDSTPIIEKPKPSKTE